MTCCFLNVKVCQISVHLVSPVNLTHVQCQFPNMQALDVKKRVKLSWDARLANKSLPGQKNAPLDLQIKRLSFLPPGKP